MERSAALALAEAKIKAVSNIFSYFLFLLLIIYNTDLLNVSNTFCCPNKVANSVRLSPDLFR